MRQLTAIAIVVALTMGGCGKSEYSGGKSGKNKPLADEPAKVVTMNDAYMKKGDIEGVWSLYSTEARKGFDEMFSSLSDEEAKEMFGEDSKGLKKLEGLALMKKLASTDAARRRMEASKDYKVQILRVEECAADKDMIACRPSGKGTVVFFSPKEGEECRIRLIQEGGGWKMADANFACSRSSPRPGKGEVVPEPKPTAVAPREPKPPEPDEPPDKKTD